MARLGSEHEEIIIYRPNGLNKIYSKPCLSRTNWDNDRHTWDLGFTKKEEKRAKCLVLAQNHGQNERNRGFQMVKNSEISWSAEKSHACLWFQAKILSKF